MMKKLMENKLVHAIVALVLSIGFWSYVVTTTNPEYTSWLTVSKVSYEGLSDITEKGYYFDGEMPETIEIKVEGPRRLVTKVTEDYSASVDFTNIKGAGEYNLEVKVNVPAGVTVKRIKPETLKVRFDSGKRKLISPTLDIYGENAENYEISILSDVIPVSGPSTVISKISDVVVKINADDIEKTGEAMYKAISVDSEGNEVPDKHLSFDNVVKVDIKRIKDVKVIVDESIVPAYIRDNYTVEFATDVKTVKVVGYDDKLETVEVVEADISTVILDPSSGTQKAEVKVSLPDGVMFAQDTKDTAVATITYQPIPRGTED